MLVPQLPRGDHGQFPPEVLLVSTTLDICKTKPGPPDVVLQHAVSKVADVAEIPSYV